MADDKESYYSEYLKRLLKEICAEESPVVYSKFIRNRLFIYAWKGFHLIAIAVQFDVPFIL